MKKSTKKCKAILLAIVLAVVMLFSACSDKKTASSDTVSYTHLIICGMKPYGRFCFLFSGYWRDGAMKTPPAAAYYSSSYYWEYIASKGEAIKGL